MPDPAQLIPDAGETLRLALGTVPAITAITADRVSLRLSGPRPAIRYVVVGGSSGYARAEPRLQIECWGAGDQAPDDGTASLLARTVAAEVEGLRGQFGDAWVAGMWVEGVPIDRTDPTTDRPRIDLTVGMDLSPLPA